VAIICAAASVLSISRISLCRFEPTAIDHHGKIFTRPWLYKRASGAMRLIWQDQIREKDLVRERRLETGAVDFAHRLPQYATARIYGREPTARPKLTPT
jgi:hypothetical protein